MYVGFASGLTEEQLWEIPGVHCYWGAAGAWNVARCGVAMRQQYPEVMIVGMQFDVNVANASRLMIALGRAPNELEGC